MGKAVTAVDDRIATRDELAQGGQAPRGHMRRVRVVCIVCTCLAAVFALGLFLLTRNVEPVAELIRSDLQEYSGQSASAPMLAATLEQMVVWQRILTALLFATAVVPMAVLAKEYRALSEESRQRYDHVQRAASHDPLTGLCNRKTFDEVLGGSVSDMALMLIDVDGFEDVNNRCGHDVGDRVLMKLAELLLRTFRATDYACRIGGDEFAVVLTNATPQIRDVLERKIGQLRDGLLDESDGLPAMTLSVGVAFGREGDARDVLYGRANRMLNEVKGLGRDGYAFFPYV